MPRPTLYNDDIGEEILAALADGATLTFACSGDHMPERHTVTRWVVSRDPEMKGFQDAYALARMAGAHIMADEIIEIGDDGTLDMITKKNKDGSEYEAVDAEHIQRSKLRCDNRKFLIGKFAPNVFGDSIALTGKDGGAIETKEIGNGRDLGRRIAFLLTGGAPKALTAQIIDAESEAVDEPAR
jgi:hypothetical protein